MAKAADRLDKIIQAYIKRLSEEISIDQVILFGSYASGNQDRDSDIDLAVFSKDFERRPYLDNLQYLALKKLKVDFSIEALPYTPEEYKNADPRSFLGEVIRTGQVIYPGRKSKRN